MERAREELIKGLSIAAGDQLKMLLEEKHLYQYVVIDAKALIEASAASVRAMGIRMDVDVTEFDKTSLVISPYQLTADERGGRRPGPPIPTLILKNVKLFCSQCDEREVFSAIWHCDVTDAVLRTEFSSPACPEGFQLFVLAFQCQLCKGKLEGFVVRRDGWRLSLHGRSPMEHIDVPKYIPKVERNLFREAMVASHGGKTLAALFYLRLFIEQFARRVTGETGRRFGDELMEAYGKTLPPAHAGAMPSLREWYEKLSGPIHAAKEDNKLFEEARAAIEQHFDIRRVFKIPETTPPPKP
jgi:hypothetical protein